MDFDSNGYINGFLERKAGIGFQGRLTIDGVDISPIVGEYFKKDGKTCLWLKRRPLLEYDEETMSYKTRPRKPQWETYLTKQCHDTIAYKGEFAFLHFRYEIVGVWDKVLGKEKQRLNFFVERLPMKRQTIINGINETNRTK